MATRGRGATDEAAQLDKQADVERARMHSMLSELATLESELKDLESTLSSLGEIPRASARSLASASAYSCSPLAALVALTVDRIPPPSAAISS